MMCACLCWLLPLQWQLATCCAVHARQSYSVSRHAANAFHLNHKCSALTHKYYRHVQLIGKTLGGTCTSQFTQLLCDVTASTTALGTAAAGKGARYINVAAAFEGPLAAGQCGAPHAVCSSNLIADCCKDHVGMLRKAQDERVFWAQDPVHCKLVTCVATPVDAVDLCQHNGSPQRHRVEEHQCYDAPNPAKPG